MLLGGLQKTTLIDFPARVACTVFTVGCNWRCPFCHNKDLVTKKLFSQSGLKFLKEEDFFKFLDKRKKILEGVCITGGEPLLQPDLAQFCQQIKDLDLVVKLDTNGSRPELLKQIIKKKLVDFVAMDIKTNFKEYQKAIGLQWSIAKIKESIKIILRSGLEYELRTTVVPGIHNKKNLLQLVKQLRTLNRAINWVLQPFRPQNCLDPAYLKIKPYSSQEMKDLLKLVQKILPQTRLRRED